MVILGIDPGTARTGYGVISSKNGTIEAVAYGCIKTDKDTPREQRLAILHRALLEVIEEQRPDVMAQELLFFNKNTKTALLVGEARGVILLAAAQSSLPVKEYTPLQVKGSLAGYGRASKSDVKEVVKLHLGLEKIKGSDDVADALATALCHLFHLETGDIR
ncbi:MAG: crossover junction endodeoxyribonuclease RuvC [Candidatus Eremiobacteraeota bacterium]|nr:crossover junction endodeoxyribonuclease RuvC [Candidatus Eremiobacteraeota bacterium]